MCLKIVQKKMQDKNERFYENSSEMAFAFDVFSLVSQICSSKIDEIRTSNALHMDYGYLNFQTKQCITFTTKT